MSALASAPEEQESGCPVSGSRSVLRAEWPQKVLAAYADEMKRVGKQTKTFTVITTCSGTGCPTIALQDQLSDAPLRTVVRYWAPSHHIPT